MEFNREDGWQRWEYNRPCLDAPVQIHRKEWREMSVIMPKELHEAANIVGLYWRPTGIYRELQDRLPPQVYQYMNSINSNYGFGAGIGMLSSLLGVGASEFSSCAMGNQQWI